MSTRVDLEPAAERVAQCAAQWTADGLWTASTLLGPEPAAPGGDGEPPAEHLVVEVTGPDWKVGLVVDLSPGGRVRIGFVSETDAVWERRRVRSLDAWDAMLERAVGRASRMRLEHGQLVARTCTTGRLDWVHGNLWVMPACLLRTRSGWLETVVNTYATGTSARRSGHSVGYDPAAILSAHRTNKIIPFRDIVHARLRRGIATSSLTVQMADGTRHKLRWRSSDPAHRLLADRLLPVLGPRLTI
ncbi:hypothetical protein [Actinacidiphila sp. ITFR-21]|uniref:hypothetical protein n=1 Tax=Actinacidiphila sp. ITFR-21 TaxID=3075199 RepID=UPI00288C4261|nr:hypothetical protein [Streptomyces sp. ITFR-21]WNI19045.1 hypothetical protein RLT57_28280 [Streptomyces sp. ITFR-21]